MKALSLFAGLLAFSLITSNAQGRYAIVDMKKVFDSYYKTKQAEAQIKDRAANEDKQYKIMVEDYKQLNQDYKALVDASNDQALSAEEREKKKKAAESKLLEIQSTEKSVKQFEQQARTTIGEMEKRMREKIVGEIREIVNTKAKSGGFSIVFDLAAQTVYQTPFILYSSGENDLTATILNEMNANAPADFLSSLNTAEPVKETNSKTAKPPGAN